MKNSISGAAEFKKESFDVIMESVFSGILRRFKTAENINSLFCFLWMCLEMNGEEISKSCNHLNFSTHSFRFFSPKSRTKV